MPFFSGEKHNLSCCQRFRWCFERGAQETERYFIVFLNKVTDNELIARWLFFVLSVDQFSKRYVNIFTKALCFFLS